MDKSEKSDHDVDLFEALCDFNVLYALDGMMKKADMDDICKCLEYINSFAPITTLSILW